MIVILVAFTTFVNATALECLMNIKSCSFDVLSSASFSLEHNATSTHIQFFLYQA